MATREVPTILVAEDDAGDRARLRKAFEASGLALNLRFVGSTQELLAYLHHAPPCAGAEIPDLILLNFEIGLEVLSLLKRDPELRRIPVIVMTNPQKHDDVDDAYGRGATSSISKSRSAEGLATTVGVLSDFYLRVCTLPGSRPDDLRD